MPLKVVPITCQQCEDVQEIAQQVWDKAQSGELRGLAVIGLTADGCISTRFTMGDASHAFGGLLAGTQVLAHRILTETD